MPARAPFSAYPGIDRFIACLAGKGLSLERAAGRCLAPCQGEALSFAGEELVVGEPLGPGVKDVNLMLRRGRWRGRMLLSRGGAVALVAPVVIIHAPFQAVAVDGAREIAAGCTLIAEGCVTVSGAAVACELTPV